MAKSTKSDTTHWCFCPFLFLHVYWLRISEKFDREERYTKTANAVSLCCTVCIHFDAIEPPFCSCSDNFLLLLLEMLDSYQIYCNWRKYLSQGDGVWHTIFLSIPECVCVMELRWVLPRGGRIPSWNCQLWAADRGIEVGKSQFRSFKAVSYASRVLCLIHQIRTWLRARIVEGSILRSRSP